MKKNIVLLGVLLAVSATSLFAHGPVRRAAKESIEINATPEAVWEIIKDFDKLDAWLPLVEKVEAKGGNDKGAERVLTLKGGGTITEELKKYDAKKMKYAYKITDMSVASTVTHEGKEVPIPVLPVHNYSAKIQVKKKGDGSVVNWNAKFYRAYMNNNPPAELTDDVGMEAVTGVLKVGLENLKEMAEK